MTGETQTREVERRKLNIIEGLILAALVGLAGSNLLLRDTVVQVKAQNEALVGRIDSLSAQMADIPTLSTRVSQLEVRQSADAEAIRELRATRGLR